MDETRDDTLDRLRAQLQDRYQVERKLGPYYIKATWSDGSTTTGYFRIKQ